MPDWPPTGSTAQAATARTWTTARSRPPLRGTAFRAKWYTRSVEALFTETATTMPQDRPDSLGDETYTDLIAFLLQENGIEAGTEPLPADPTAMAALSTGWRSGGGGLSAGVVLPPVPVRRNPLDNIRPVTDAMLENPDDGDWLLWRRTYDAAGYSPLREITPANVAGLRPAWSWSLPPGPSESTPIVHDGVLFVHGFGDKVHALDAASGDLLWEYARRLPRDVAPSLKRGMSIYGERLYLPASDLHVVALDVRTGAVEWETKVVGPGERVRLTGGTLVARGTVMVGTTGRAGGGNFIIGLDAETGDERWRFNTIPPPTRRAAIRGTAWRTRTATAARSGFPAATTRCTTWLSSDRATRTTRGRCAIPWHRRHQQRRAVPRHGRWR